MVFVTYNSWPNVEARNYKCHAQLVIEPSKEVRLIACQLPMGRYVSSAGGETLQQVPPCFAMAKPFRHGETVGETLFLMSKLKLKDRFWKLRRSCILWRPEIQTIPNIVLCGTFTSWSSDFGARHELRSDKFRLSKHAKVMSDIVRSSEPISFFRVSGF